MYTQIHTHMVLQVDLICTFTDIDMFVTKLYQTYGGIALVALEAPSQVLSWGSRSFYRRLRPKRTFRWRAHCSTNSKTYTPILVFF